MELEFVWSLASLMGFVLASKKTLNDWLGLEKLLLWGFVAFFSYCALWYFSSRFFAVPIAMFFDGAFPQKGTGIHSFSVILAMVSLFFAGLFLPAFLDFLLEVQRHHSESKRMAEVAIKRAIKRSKTS